MKKLKFRRLLSLMLVSVMVLPFVPSAMGNNGKNTLLGASAAESSARYDTVSFENVTGQMDLTSVQISNFSDKVLKVDSDAVKNTVRTVIIGLDSPSVSELTPEGQNVSDYLTTHAGKKAVSDICKQQKTFLNDLKNRGVNYKLVDSYNVVLNAVAIEIKLDNLSLIKGLDTVSMAVVSETYSAPKTVEVADGAQSNPSNVYASGVYDTSKYLDQYDGNGITVAVLDTGLDYTHEAFQTDPTELGMELGDVDSVLAELRAVQRSADKGEVLSANDLYVSDKVPFAYDYADHDPDVYPSYSNHGTHVAGIVAGQADSYTDKDGKIATDEDGNVISFRGSAPNAQLVICKVFTDDLDSKNIGGAIAEDIIAALEDCVTLGVDVINMSLGTSAGFSSISVEGDSEGLLLNTVYSNIRDTGISLICAASNDYSSGFGSAFGTNLASNPDSGTIGSPSTFTGAMSVASINGQLSPYMTVNVKGKTEAIFYNESTDENSVENDFALDMLGDDKNGTFSYVVIPGVGQAVNYSASVKKILNNNENGPVIAVIQRGITTFEEKVELAQSMGADAVIVYNNVAGTVRMNLGDLDIPIPAVSVSIDAGEYLKSSAGGVGRVGQITIDKANLAGPFMNDYSSWGSTPDLKLKPDVTAHGGEITSTVPGGYDEQSGTSMASPNLAGLVALVRGYIRDNNPTLSDLELTKLVNQVIMSTATTVYDEEKLPYSPRKQGAGLATVDNIFTTNAYLYTLESEGGAEDDRPKVELGEDEEKNGVYDVSFYVKNFGDTALTFELNSIFFTETLGIDGYAVAEAAYLLDGSPVWTISEVEDDSVTTSIEGNVHTITVSAGKSAKISVKLSLSGDDKAYLNKTFVNGMYIEGFVKLVSKTNGQCDLNLPFMGFFGDWEQSPMLDYDAYDISDFEQDNQYNDTNRPKERVWATQAFSMYYNAKYVIPMGSFVYIQDEYAENQVYTNRDYAAISGYNDYYGEESYSNYVTTTGIKALYAGLLRNAELVTYNLYDENTGELIVSDREYRVGKAYAAGGGSTPAQVLLEKTPYDWGLEANGQYRLEFRFWFDADDSTNPDMQDIDNTFEITFYVDYEAPVLTDTRIRYYDYTEGNKTKQRIYLDLDIFDNHYTQAVLLCYAEQNEEGVTVLNLATEYVTPVYKPNKNGTTTVSIDITDLYDSYQNRLYVQIDDYALNHNIYSISISKSNSNALPDTFEVADSTNLTLSKNTTKKIALVYEGNANLSNFNWTSANPSIAKVKNGEVFGVSAGSTVITVSANGVSRRVNVTVTDSDVKLNLPSISFGMIENSEGSIVRAQGMVDVNAGETFTLPVVIDPWYYPADALKLKWKSSNEKIATVTQDGVVKVNSEEDIVTITAVIMDGEKETLYSAFVTLDVQDPFNVSNFTLNKYHGDGGVVKIPDDKNIMYIGEEAFKDNDNITTIIIPKTVVQIHPRAFKNCSALEYVYFIDDTKLEVPESALSLIYEQAFFNCPKLKKVDLSNVKIVTVDDNAFTGCTSLTEIVDMYKMATLYDGVFSSLNYYDDDGNAKYAPACTSLANIDITGLRMAGDNVFAGCTSLTNVVTSQTTALGYAMFKGCTKLQTITINCPNVPANAFENCGGLKTINFGDSDAAKKDTVFNIGNNAFSNCFNLSTVNFNGYNVSYVGDYAFSGCESLTEFVYTGNTEFGTNVFENSPVTIVAGSGVNKEGVAFYDGTTLVKVVGEITSDFAIKDGTTYIMPYAFEGVTVQAGVTNLTVPESVVKIGKGAFAGLNIDSITLSSNVTEISDSAFENSSIKSFVVDANVLSIGANAFAGCSSLATVTFENGSKLEAIYDMAFANTSISNIILPDGASYMGNMVFSNCKSLKTIDLPSLNYLGVFTFRGCTSIETVNYGVNATVTGTYTFSSFGQGASALKTVVLGNKTTYIEPFTFYGNKSIKSIELSSVTEIGEGAFAYCSALETVNGLEDVTIIGLGAFIDCTSLKSLNLESAITIGSNAFANNELVKTYTAVTLGDNLVSIGDYAFFGGNMSAIKIPAKVEKIGAAAVSSASNLVGFEVDDNNTIFFEDDGVLYRYVQDELNDKVKYELVAYPSAKIAQSETISIKEGTVTIKAYAVSGLNEGVAKKLVIPYSVKSIGSGAFALSGITDYTFNAITAPKLLTEMMETGLDGFRGLTYINFETSLLNYVNLEDFSKPTSSKLILRYPTNGNGYDNYIYKTYFGERILLGELMDDTTRTLKEALTSFIDADTVSLWLNQPITDTLKQQIVDFSAQVKEAHRLLNNTKSEVQLGFLTEDVDLINKLYDIEKALKPVKERFGINMRVSSLTIDSTSTYKTNYVAGESFVMDGLKLIVTYDDYSQEAVDMTKASIDAGYQGALTEYHRYVVISAYGETVRVPISVSAKPVDDNPNPNPPVQDNQDDGGCKSSVFTMDLGLVFTMLVSLGVIILIRKVKREDA